MIRGKWRDRIGYARYRVRAIVRETRHFLRAHWLVVLVALLIAGGVLRAIAWGSYNLYRFNRGFNGLLESEWSKTLITGWPRFQIIKRINTFLPEDAVVLIYREADFAYYGKRKYYCYRDDTLADYVQMKEAREVWQFLRGKGITHILVPPYPMPSIYNTRLADVLASSVYSRLEFDVGGYRVYSLKKEPGMEPGARTLVAQDFHAHPELREGWRIFTPSLLSRLLLWLQAGKEKSLEWPQIPAFAPLLTLPDSDRLAYTGRIKFRYSPLMMHEEFPFQENATYGFSAAAEGFGYFQIYLYAYRFGFNSPGENGAAGSALSVQRILIWSGVLHGETRQIRARFIVPPFLVESHQIVRPKRAYRIVIHAGSNLASIRLRRWAIHALAGAESRAFLQSKEWADKRNFLNEGWKISASLHADPIQGLLFGKSQDGYIYFFNDTRQPAKLVSPVFTPAPNWRTHRRSGNPAHGNEAANEDEMLDPALQPVGVLHFRARGHGLVEPGILFICQDSEGRVYAQRHAGEMSYVLTARERAFDVEVPAPCHVRALGMTLRLSRDKASAIPKSRLRLPFIQIRDVRMARKFINKAGERSTHPFRPTRLAPAYFLKDPPMN